MVFDIGYILSQWDSIGVFQYLLPFLLVFAIVFGILETTRVLSKNKGIHAIIALVIALLSIGYTSMMGYSLGDFLKELFPRLGIGIAVLLCVLILIGLFVSEDQKKYWLIGLGALGIITVLIVVVKSFNVYGLWGLGNYENSVGWIIGAILLIGIIIAVATSGESNKDNSKKAPQAIVLKEWR